MKVFTSRIPDVLIFEQSVHADDRGYFTETWRQSIFDEQGIDVTFVQDNQSNSSRGTLRGLHYQLNHPQGKLARVVSGEVFDVAVDNRKSSTTFGHWTAEILSAENKKQLWIPAGFAHGFQVISEEAEVLYKTTCYWSKQQEITIDWADPHLKIKWPQNSMPIISEKDRNNAISFEEFQTM